VLKVLAHAIRSAGVPWLESVMILTVTASTVGAAKTSCGAFRNQPRFNNPLSP
jgi:hypothetical protein